MGDFFGAPSVDIARWWTVPEGPVRLIRHRFVLPGRVGVQSYDTFTKLGADPTPKQPTRMEWETFILSDKLTVSRVHYIDRPNPSERSISDLHLRRLQRQENASDRDLGRFLYLLIDGFVFPEDEVTD